MFLHWILWLLTDDFTLEGELFAVAVVNTASVIPLGNTHNV